MPIMGDEELEALAEAIHSQKLCRERRGANAVSRFEDAFADYLGCKYVYAVNSGTSANEAALIAAGVGPGDEVICPPCSFIATSLSAVSVGAVPVFSDVNPMTLILDPDEIEPRITDRTKAVVVVHLFGQPAPMDEIASVTKRNGLKLVEDCAQAYGSLYKGVKVGTFGDVSCFSLQQSKHITAGEGGMIATDDQEAYKKAALFSNIGMPSYRYEIQRPDPAMFGNLPTRGHLALGHNHRMSELQGAVALVQLSKIEEFNERRRVLVGLIRKHLSDLEWLDLPEIRPDAMPNWWEYPIRLKGDSALSAVELGAKCQEEGFSLGCYREVNYLEEVYQEMNRSRMTSLGQPLPDYVRYEPGICPKAEEGASRLLSITTHHGNPPDLYEQRMKDLREFIVRILSRK